MTKHEVDAKLQRSKGRLRTAIAAFRSNDLEHALKMVTLILDDLDEVEEVLCAKTGSPDPTVESRNG